MSYIHLQGIGVVNAKYCKDVKVGDKLSYNYAYSSYEVTNILRESAKTVWLEVKELRTGKILKESKRKNSLIGIGH